MSMERIDCLPWRFVICLASFYVNGITWGFISSSGLFENALRNTYQLSSFKSILPGSIQIASMSISSVFASLLTIQCGLQWTIITGAFISTIGSILSAVIGEYWAFCFFYGLFIGIGEALMLVPAVLVIPSYFHSSRISLATATAVSGASIGMFVIPFVLQYLLDTYALHGTILLGACLWLTVALVGIVFGQGTRRREDDEEEEESLGRINTQISVRTNDDIDGSVLSQGQSMKLGNGLIHNRRGIILSPTSVCYHQQKHKYFSSICQELHQTDKLPIHTPITYEGLPSHSHLKSPSSINTSPILLHHNSSQLMNNNAEKDSFENNCLYSWKIFLQIGSLVRNPMYCILMISMIFIWSFDKTNFLFVNDLLKSSGQSEHRSILLIGISGISDLLGQLFFGYLGDIECINLYVLWICTSIVAGLSISVAPLIGSCGMVGLCIIFAIHGFFLAAPNALSNVLMIEVVGIDHYPIAYGFSLHLSGSTSLFGYPILGFIKDKTRSWTIPFALVSVTMIFGGLIIGLIPLYLSHQKRQSINR